eukprot:TRINITY_DN27495_c0_g1_i1.p1 TRINITY_DN27495_c0_g1~~TRINITY_DN27495_c0_g1_i1.p1  ORF type:complete len:512 (-),score=147.09 TRINITY_DN27495_c0_g1_i1:152-1687(-)
MLCSVQPSATAWDFAGPPPPSSPPPAPPPGLGGVQDGVSLAATAAVVNGTTGDGFSLDVSSLQATIDREVEARFARESAIIRGELDSLEQAEARKQADLDEKLKAMAEKNKALEDNQAQVRAQIEQLTAMLGKSMMPPGAGAFPHSFGGPPSFGGAGGFGGWGPGVMTAPPPIPPAQQIAMAFDAAFKQKQDSTPSPAQMQTPPPVIDSSGREKALPQLPKFPVSEQKSTSTEGGANLELEPRSPRQTTFSCMQALGRPPRCFDQMQMPSSAPPPQLLQSPLLSPKRVPAPRAPRAQTPQGRGPPQQREAMCRAPWSLLGSPTPAKSPTIKKMSAQRSAMLNSTPSRLMQSPGVPQSPFIIMEDGGSQFSFTMRKADGVELGLDFGPNPIILVVRGILPGGAVEAWNKQCAGGPAAGKAVMVGDRVVSANGISDVPGMIKECSEKQLIKLLVQRDGPGSLGCGDRAPGDFDFDFGLEGMAPAAIEAPPVPPLGMGFLDVATLGPPPGLELS